MKRKLRYIANIYCEEDGKLFCKQLLNQDTIESIFYDVLSFIATHNVTALQVEVKNYIHDIHPKTDWYALCNGEFVK